jgi:pimeloyl-ACP methyl ester carboxylesterase
MDINGMMVHYRDEGEGPVLFLIHGTFSSLHTFNSWTRILKTQYRIVRLDLPGFALTGPMTDGKYDIEVYLSFLNKFLNNLNIKKCHIAGSSLGGWLAWEYCVANPKMVDKLILIGAAGLFVDQRLPLPFIMAKAPLIKKFVKHVLPKGLVEKFLKEVYGDTHKVTGELVERYYDLVMKPGNREAFIDLVNTKYEFHGDLVSQIESPTMIMWGKEDNWVTLKNAYAFHERIKDSIMVLYDGVGHVPMEESPMETASDLISFLENVN